MFLTKVTRKGCLDRRDWLHNEALRTEKQQQKIHNNKQETKQLKKNLQFYLF